MAALSEIAPLSGTTQDKYAQSHINKDLPVL